MASAILCVSSRFFTAEPRLFEASRSSPASFSVTAGDFVQEKSTQHLRQVVKIQNTGSTPASAPLFLALDNLTPGVTLANADGVTGVLAPLGSPYVRIPVGEDGVLRPHETKTVTLDFIDPSNAAISSNVRVLPVTPAP